MTQTNIPNTNIPVATEDNLFTTGWFIYLQGVYKAIRAKFNLNISGILSVNTTSVSNVGVAETDLINYKLVKNTLQNNGDILTIKSWGSFATNVNNKQVKLKFGSQMIFDSSSLPFNGSWEINSTIIRTSPTSQEIVANISYTSSLNSPKDSITRTLGNQDLTLDNIIKCTGQAIATDDITQYSMIVGLTPNDN